MAIQLDWILSGSWSRNLPRVKLIMILVQTVSRAVLPVLKSMKNHRRDCLYDILLNCLPVPGRPTSTHPSTTSRYPLQSDPVCLLPPGSTTFSVFSVCESALGCVKRVRTPCVCSPRINFLVIHLSSLTFYGPALSLSRGRSGHSEQVYSSG